MPHVRRLRRSLYQLFVGRNPSSQLLGTGSCNISSSLTTHTQKIDGSRRFSSAGRRRAGEHRRGGLSAAGPSTPPRVAARTGPNRKVKAEWCAGMARDQVVPRQNKRSVPVRRGCRVSRFLGCGREKVLCMCMELTESSTVHTDDRIRRLRGGRQWRRGRLTGLSVRRFGSLPRRPAARPITPRSPECSVEQVDVMWKRRGRRASIGRRSHSSDSEA